MYTSVSTSALTMKPEQKPIITFYCTYPYKVHPCLNCNLVFSPQTVKMAVNWPGLASIGVFYLIVLGTGIWASRKSKREERKCTGNRSEVAMVGGRNLNIWVSIFTMAGRKMAMKMITVNVHNRNLIRVIYFEIRGIKIEC